MLSTMLFAQVVYGLFHGGLAYTNAVPLTSILQPLYCMFDVYSYNPCFVPSIYFFLIYQSSTYLPIVMIYL